MRAVKPYKDYLSAPTMRTLRLPATLWKAGKEYGERSKQPMRMVLEQACQAIPHITQSLKSMGVRGEFTGANKVVRAPLSKAVLDAMRLGHEQTGLPQVQMLALALHHLTTTATADIKPAASPDRKRRRKPGRNRRSKPQG